MGIEVTTSFETPQGFSVTSVYIRLQQMNLLLQGPTARVTVFFSASLSRTKRSAQPLMVPAMPTSATFDAPLADCIRYEVLYAHIRRVLEARRFVCTPVLEDGQTLVEYVIPGASPQSSESTQTTPPTPPTPSEPAPESPPEPQQPPSSEYAPAPAATEA